MSEIEKLTLHSPDITAQNIDRIAALFPSCVTEAAGEGGTLRRAIDFDLLRQELSGSIVEGPQERYHLDWPGKRAAMITANAPIAKTLRPVRAESVDFDTTRNLFIEGDNLEALKLLQETYLGRVKMIYIDPPYNTGNDFVYDDDFAESAAEFLAKSNQVDAAGNRLVANTAANGRFHSDWLSMMYARLKLAKNLLTKDGAIFISIDDNEVANLIKVGSEVFGSENFVAQIAVQLNPRGRHLERFIANTHEYVVVFVMDGLNSNCIDGIEKEGRMAEEYNQKDEGGAFRLLGLRNRNQSFNPETRPNLYFPLFVNPENGKVSLNQSEQFQDEVWPNAPDGVKTCWTWGREKIMNENETLIAHRTGDEWRIYRKDYLNKDGEGVSKTMVKSLWADKEITNDYGRSAIKDLFSESIMDFPKSTDLLARLVKIGSRKNDIVLDFFAGSATMAHSILGINAKEGSNRKFILVQLDEETPPSSSAAKAGFSTIAEISKERIRRAGAKILAGESHPDWNRDVGFRVLKIDTSNMADVYYTPDKTRQADLLARVDNIKQGRTGEDLLFQVLLSWGLDLTLPITREMVDGREVFTVDNGLLLACFDDGISVDFARTIAPRKPLRAVFKDSAFADDAAKINIKQIFAALSPDTELKVI